MPYPGKIWLENHVRPTILTRCAIPDTTDDSAKRAPTLKICTEQRKLCPQLKMICLNFPAEEGAGKGGKQLSWNFFLTDEKIYVTFNLY